MKRGITLERDFENGTVTIRKAKGKLTLDEITDALLTAPYGEYYGRYAILLNCSEAAAEGSGWPPDDDEPQGDLATLCSIEAGERCPICSRMTPLLEYCPSCGEKLPLRDKEASRC